MRRRQLGYLMIVLLVILVVVASLAAVLSYLATVNATSGASHLGSMLALFQAESGLEYEQRRWSQNLNWYRSANDPNPSIAVAQVLGTGTFAVSSNLPATLVKTAFSPVAATLNVYTTERFPASGILQVDDNVSGAGEYLRYTGVVGTTFTGVTRGQTVGTVNTTAGVHTRNDTVYPVTILRTAMPANCTFLASIQVDANSKFLNAGTLDIEGEEVSYASAATVGATTTLSGVTRCLGLVSSVAHAVGQPVTPVLVGGDSADNQVEMLSTGTQGTNIRYARRTIQR